MHGIRLLFFLDGGTPLHPSPDCFLTKDWNAIISLSVFLGVPLIMPLLAGQVLLIDPQQLLDGD